MKVSEILDNIDGGGLSLPMFQRGYVWTRPQVRNLMQSLYRDFPVGGLLLWETRAENVDIRSSGQVSASGKISLLLDGQQRVTSLYGIMRGKTPPFFDGDASAFAGLYFHLENEEFEFRSPVKMALDNRWMAVTELFEKGPSRAKIADLRSSSAYTEDQLEIYTERAHRILNVRNTDFPVQLVTGEDKTTDVVVEIFNEVNSGGRKLSKGDLALARIGGHWPEVREEMQRRLSKWRQAGFTADRDWLLRCVTALVADASEYEHLRNKPIVEIQQALEQSEPVIDCLLEATRTHLGMDTDKVHKSKQAFPVMVKYLANSGGDFPNDAAKAQLLHWYISASIWGRFSGPTETIINQDLAALRTDNPIEALRQNLIRERGNRTVGPENFNFNRTSARFYPLMHIMSRVCGAKDWGTGKTLPDHESSPQTSLELHHIFPKAYLRKNGYTANDANNFGNYAFQTRNTNIGIGARSPCDYMPEVSERQLGALESQWVPNDPKLWKVENYPKFLAERRHLLAEAANEFLSSLLAGNLPDAATSTTAGGLDAEEEEAILEELNTFVSARGLSSGELGYELRKPDSAGMPDADGDPILDANGETILLDLAWPNGLQDHFSEPVAVLIDEEPSVRIAANNAGFGKIFTDPEAFRAYVRELVGEDDEEVAEEAA